CTAQWATASIGGRPDAATTGDQLARYEACLAPAMAAVDAPGARDRTISLGFGDYSGLALMKLAATDQFTHGWDLARAIGRPSDLDPDLAEDLLVHARLEIPEAFRGADGQAPFGPIVAPRAGSGPADQLAAFLGRA